jgi:hypothetical protein
MSEEKLVYTYKSIKIKDISKEVLNPTTIDLTLEFPTRVTLQKSSFSPSHPHPHC